MLSTSDVHQVLCRDKAIKLLSIQCINLFAQNKEINWKSEAKSMEEFASFAKELDLNFMKTLETMMANNQE